jgi:hypothetical protein
MFAFYLTSK